MASVALCGTQTELPAALPRPGPQPGPLIQLGSSSPLPDCLQLFVLVPASVPQKFAREMDACEYFLTYADNSAVRPAAAAAADADADAAAAAAPSGPLVGQLTSTCCTPLRHLPPAASPHLLGPGGGTEHSCC